MSILGNVRIGQKAPDFRCEAVCKGIIEGISPTLAATPPLTPIPEVSLKTYISAEKKAWLVRSTLGKIIVVVSRLRQTTTSALDVPVVSIKYRTNNLGPAGEIETRPPDLRSGICCSQCKSETSSPPPA